MERGVLVEDARSTDAPTESRHSDTHFTLASVGSHVEPGCVETSLPYSTLPYWAGQDKAHRGPRDRASGLSVLVLALLLRLYRLCELGVRARRRVGAGRLVVRVGGRDVQRLLLGDLCVLEQLLA